SNLPVERGLALGAQPRRYQQVEIGGGQPTLARSLHVRTERTLVNGGRQRSKHVGLVAYQPKELRAPRGQRDDVDQRQRPERQAVQQVSTQRHRAAVVVRDHVWKLELPVRQ